MSSPEESEEVARIETELRSLQRLGAIEYYLPFDPAGEWYVIGINQQILNMDQEQVMCFLAGTSAVTRLLAREAGMVA